MSDDLETLRSRYRVALHYLDESRTKSDRNRWFNTIFIIKKEIHNL